MTTNYDFDKIVDRSGTATVKHDALQEEFGRSDLLPLWVADMDFEVCPAITQALSRRIEGNHIYGYTVPSPGYWQSIIDWQARRNGFGFTRDELTFIPGVVTGFGLALNFFTRPGDKVVIQEPVYHPFRRLIAGNGRRVVNNALLNRGNGCYEMDLEGLERIFKQEEPRMMVLCNPHNPIGIAWPASVLRQVASLARKHGVIVFDDEIHSDLMLYGHKHAAFAAVSDDAAAVALTLGAPTKTFNIAGLESSWCVVKNPDLHKPFYNWLGTNELNSPAMVATLATEAAYTCGEPWLEQCLHYIEANVDYVAAYCRQHLDGIVAVKPQASYLVWLDCTALGLSHEQLVSLFVDKAHLALNDGAMFGRGGEGHMRLNCATPRSNLVEAMRRLTDAI